MTFTKKLLTLVVTYKFLRKMYKLSQGIKENEQTVPRERYEN